MEGGWTRVIPFDAERLQSLMRGQGVDVLLATTRHNVRYLSGGYYMPFFAHGARFADEQYMPIVAIPAGEMRSAFYIGREDEPQYLHAFGPLWIATIHGIARGSKMTVQGAETAASLLRAQGFAGGTIAIEFSFLPAIAFHTLHRSLPEASFSDATPILGELRAVKSPAELERLREVHSSTAEAVRATLSAGHPDQTTSQISAAVQRRIQERGASFLYALTNVGPGLGRAPSSERWGRGRPLQIDAGGRLEEYTSDIARMGSIGPAPPPAPDMFAACLAAQERVRGMVGAGVSCRDLQRIGTEALTATPWGDYGRFAAHGIGLVSHEPPEVTIDSGRRLEAGMVLSIETEYRHPDVGHVKLEDSIAVTQTGCEGLGDVERDWCTVSGA
jgi:Xaa-Pro aminopeptidase